ncbi:hypothetical protein PILCRDRAFT_819474 [Piloderma croceum F 1598]|uniref:Shelterin complex subunit TPP1/Est3 domain-containing protein n=1 Tax=Piloderma croceum (strain F 1598) TaxID=765440 RepID=A0A0C3FYE3_PILCF|nr:hypothetical protein PILCRDRAFT_819474 [Piloderma croceum F 1598]
MADSFRSWICAYLIDIGETYGGNLSDAPYWEKKKKVQLVEFLTFPTSTEDHCPIYAKVSDKLHKIPVRFTTDALEAYSKKNNGCRLTENRNALVQIKNFRPTFCRVPIGNNVRKQSPESYLVLEVGSVEVLGSEGEGEFGNPKDIEENEKVMAWTKGLREHGGGGNVLKLRKEAEQGSGAAKTSPTRASRLPARKVVQSLPKRNNQVGKKRAESGSKTTSASPPKPVVPPVNHALELYKREFRVRLPLFSISQKGN